MYPQPLIFILTGRKCPHNPVEKIRKIEATILFSIEGRIAVCFRWHLGSVEQRRTVCYLMCDHHDRSERTRRTASRSNAGYAADGIIRRVASSSTNLATLK